MNEMVGNWDVKVAPDALPQKVATAFSELFGEICGASYVPLAYLGSQVVNGLNHAILAEQTLVTKNPEKNIVVVYLHELNEEFKITNIDKVLAGGYGVGAVEIAPKTEIPTAVEYQYDAVMKGFLGSVVNPFYYLASQVVNGVNYFLAAEVKPVIPQAESSVQIIMFNSTTKEVKFTYVLG